ncbi:MAG: hypothetical protein D6784_14930 [Chloroflexi bacterium]|nr:MAG: hypothetical protein D6784_14930 [Chloroflexota bacterium]
MFVEMMRNNSRTMIALVLALMLLTLATSPALAWLEEGKVTGQETTSCRAITLVIANHTSTCFSPAGTVNVVEEPEVPLLHPAVARAEVIGLR